MERILNDWTAVKALLTDGWKGDKRVMDGVLFEDQVYMNSQSGTLRLDKFAHCLVVKCSVEVCSYNF